MRFMGLAVPFGRTDRYIGCSSECLVSTCHLNVPFSEFLGRIRAGQVKSVEIDGVHFTYSLRSSLQIASMEVQETSKEDYDEFFPCQEGEMVALAQLGCLNPPAKKIIYTTTKPNDMTIPYEKMVEDGVEVRAPDKRVTNFINSSGIVLLYVGLLACLSTRSQQSAGWMRIGKRSSERSREKAKGESTTFADVAGVDEAKEELEEVVDFLKNPDRYVRLGAHPPRGVLLVGPPGTGKTLLAKAIAGEAGVPFFSCSGSEFVELYVGMGASRVREIFARAKKEAPSIIFIDEIDAVAKVRDRRLASFSNDEREQTLNQLLTELDGFESSSMVIVLAATNRADVLDPALRRPGRFDRIVMVESPDKNGREKILQVHVRKNKVPVAENVELKKVAAATSGFTGADLANLVNEAALLAGRAKKKKVGKEDFASAVERAVGGIEKKRLTLHSIEKGVIARHEVGHAVVGTAIASLLPGHTRVQKLSILPRTGGALGFTYIPPASEDRYLLFVDELRGRLVTLLGGRAAEEVMYCGRVSTGALDDIRQATDVAYKAIAEYGLNSLIGPVSLATLSGGGLDNSNTAFPWAKDQGHVTNLVHKEVRSLLQSALSMALIVIRSNPTVLEGLGAQLEANDKVEGETLEDWLNQVVAPVELSAFVKGSRNIPAWDGSL